MHIKREMKMSSIIHKNYLLLPILQRFGIELGFGDKTVFEVCENKGIEVDFFLDIINSYIDLDYFPKKHLAGFSSKQIIDYLQRTHEYYLEVKVPLIEGMLRNLVETSRAEKKKLKLIEDFFSEYKEELLAHIKREDEVVYPYILELEKCIAEGNKKGKLQELVKKYSIHNFADEHDNMEEKLYDLKNILIKYLPPRDDQNLLQEIITELFQLENDLADHSRMEDNVLIPKIADIEKRILEKNDI